MLYRTLTGIVFFSLLFLGSISAETQDPEPMEIWCRWTAPTEGTTAVLYHLQIQQHRETESPDPLYDQTFIVPAQAGSEQEYLWTEGSWGLQYHGRVRGVDSNGNIGPWSEWSEIYWFEIPFSGP